MTWDDRSQPYANPGWVWEGGGALKDFVIARDRVIGDRESQNPYFNPLAAASISSARARMRMSSVKLVQRTVPEESTRPSGRNLDCQCQPDNIHRLRSAAKL
jgi:hypothetical protein